MSRITPVDPSHATGKVKEIFDGPLKGKAFNVFRAMAAAPAALDAYVSLAHAVAHGALSAREREVIALAIGQANHCEYCIAAHTAIGRSAGLQDDQMLGARRGAIVGDPKLHALARFALALHEKRGAVSDEDVASFTRAGYTAAQMGEVIACYSLDILTNYFNKANQTVSDFPPAPAL